MSESLQGRLLLDLGQHACTSKGGVIAMLAGVTV